MAKVLTKNSCCYLQFIFNAVVGRSRSISQFCVCFSFKGIPCPDCTAPSTQSGIIGGVVGVLLTLAVVAGIIFFLRWKGTISEYNDVMTDVTYS